MAIKKTTTKKSSKKEEKKEEKKFIEFDVKSDSFDFSGRIYPGEVQNSQNGNQYRRSYLSLCLNSLITINGCYLVETENGTFISFPGYQTKDGENRSYIFTDQDIRDELNSLAEILADKLPE